MANKYAIKITDFYDTRGDGYEAYSYWYVSDNDEDETKIVLFESESEANNFINNRIFNHAQAEAVIYSEMILNKKELIDFIGKVNDQLVLQGTVKEFCMSINLELEITYKYALYINFVNRNNEVKKHNQLYTKNNNVILFDSPEEANVIANFIYNNTDDSWANIVLYQRIIKYDDTTIVYNIYERQDY